MSKFTHWRDDDDLCRNDLPALPSCSLVGVAAFTYGKTDRRYGGPEEGGWWYDHFTPLRLVLAPARRAGALRRRLERVAAAANAGAPPLSSVTSRGEYTVVDGVELESRRPSYE